MYDARLLALESYYEEQSLPYKYLSLKVSESKWIYPVGLLLVSVLLSPHLCIAVSGR